MEITLQQISLRCGIAEILKESGNDADPISGLKI